MLYFYGLGLGLRALMRGRLTRETIKNILVPVNYWRIKEYELVFNELQPTAQDCILDIGSPKLLSLFIADKYESDVISTDINGYFIEEYNFLRGMRNIPDSRFQTMTMDGRKMNLPENSCTKVFSISVLEHIPDDGDSACVKEIARVLRKGGECYITVPFSPESAVEYKDERDFYWSAASKKKEERTTSTFFQRRYSEQDLYKRLIEPSGLKIKKVEFVGEKVFTTSDRELSRYLKPFTGPVQPLLAHLFLTKPASAYKDLSKPLAAFIVLQKQ